MLSPRVVHVTAGLAADRDPVTAITISTYFYPAFVTQFFSVRQAFWSRIFGLVYDEFGPFCRDFGSELESYSRGSLRVCSTIYHCISCIKRASKELFQKRMVKLFPAKEPLLLDHLLFRP